MRAAGAVAAVVLTALGSGVAAGPEILDTEVHIENTAYNPDSVTINVGEPVVWDNGDPIPHTVTSDDPLFDSAPMLAGATFRFTFDAAGVFAYHCDFHAAMHGIVRVSDPNALPDLVVSGLALPDAIPETIPGVQQRVDVEVRNLGLRESPLTHVALNYRYQGELHLIGAAEIEALGPDATQAVTFSWSTLLKLGDFELVAIADSDGEADEADEGNNAGTAVASVVLTAVRGIDLLDPI
ncbi:MAG TPA: CARDB domain-containing protein [Candidatus Thermoplasmatota archaeon]|jgi:plastocyanin|nr:CARDB domain-containing protein [Candidatus Thermoplasmatota archaeon]